MPTNITGTLKNALGTLLANTVVRFVPSSGATVLGSVVCIPGEQIAKTSSVGVLTVALMPGDYEVWVGNKKYFSISVSDTVSTLNLQDIITTSLVYASTLIPLYSRIPRSIFSDFTVVGSTGISEATLSSKTLAANLFSADGDRLKCFYAGKYTASVSTKKLYAYIGATVVFNTGFYTSAGSSAIRWKLELEIMRISSSSLRFFGNLHILTSASTGGVSGSTVGGADNLDLGSLDFTTTLALALKGAAGGSSYADNDIICNQASALFIPNV